MSFFCCPFLLQHFFIRKLSHPHLSVSHFFPWHFLASTKYAFHRFHKNVVTFFCIGRNSLSHIFVPAKICHHKSSFVNLVLQSLAWKYSSETLQSANSRLHSFAHKDADVGTMAIECRLLLSIQCRPGCGARMPRSICADGQLLRSRQPMVRCRPDAGISELKSS